MNRTLEMLALAATLTGLAACDGDEPQTVPIESGSARLSAGGNARDHVNALIELSADFRAAEWLSAEALDEDIGQALDVDPDAGDELADRLEELLDPKYVESEAPAEIIYRVDPELVCGDDEEGHECRDLLAKVPLRIRATAPAEGDVDLELLVGEARDNPVDLLLHRDQIAVVLDLGEASDAAQAVAVALEEAPLDVDAKGVVRVAALRQGDAAYVLEVGVDRALSLRAAVDGEAFSFGLLPSSVSARLVGGESPLLLLDAAIGALDLIVPGGMMGGEDCAGDADGFECEPTPGPDGAVALSMPGLSGVVAMEKAGEVDVRDLGLAGPLAVLYDGAPLYTFDPNPSRNGVDVTVSAAEGGLLDLRFDHAVSVVSTIHTDTLALVDDDVSPQGDQKTSVNLTGPAPHLQLGEDAIHVVDGVLRVEMPDRDVVEAKAGMCMGEGEDGLAIIACQ